MSVDKLGRWLTALDRALEEDEPDEIRDVIAEMRQEWLRMLRAELTEKEKRA